MNVIFVYNADSGFFNSVLDIRHKIVSPSTYSCNLCKITHGSFGEKEEWKKYSEASKNELTFLHKDEFEKKYKVKKYYPAIFTLSTSNSIEEFINKEVLENMKNLGQLIQHLNTSSQTR